MRVSALIVVAGLFNAGMSYATPVTISNTSEQSFTLRNDSDTFKADNLEAIVDPASVPDGFSLDPRSSSAGAKFGLSSTFTRFGAAFFADPRDPMQGVSPGEMDNITFRNFPMGARIDVFFTLRLVNSVLPLETSVILEPSSVALLSTAVLGLFSILRKVKRRAKPNELLLSVGS